MKATPVFTAGRVVYGSAYHVFVDEKQDRVKMERVFVLCLYVPISFVTCSQPRSRHVASRPLSLYVPISFVTC